MRVMVTGGTGTVGSAAVRALLGRGGVEVAVLKRGGGKPAPESTQVVVGDLGARRRCARCSRGYDVVFFYQHRHAERDARGAAGVNGARDCGVRRIVYLSVHDADKAPRLPCSVDRASCSPCFMAGIEQ